MFGVSSSGRFSNTERFLKNVQKLDPKTLLDDFAKRGVEALKNATPSATGETAAGWGYTIKKTGSSWIITWTNSNVVDGVPIVILLQYGHGTGTGGYVQGRDFINPVMRPIFDQIANEAWKAVKSA